MIPTLHTDRLTLRPYARADFETYSAHMTTDWSVHMGGPVDAERAWYWFCNDTASWAFYGWGTLAIEMDGALAGFAGLVQPPNFPEPECGWGVYPAHQGKGIAAEAGAAILAHVFAETDLETAVSYIAPANAASQRVAERIGGRVDAQAASPFGQNNIVYRHAPETLQ